MLTFNSPRAPVNTGKDKWDPIQVLELSGPLHGGAFICPGTTGMGQRCTVRVAEGLDQDVFKHCHELSKLSLSQMSTPTAQCLLESLAMSLLCTRHCSSKQAGVVCSEWALLLHEERKVAEATERSIRDQRRQPARRVGTWPASAPRTIPLPAAGLDRQYEAIVAELAQLKLEHLDLQRLCRQLEEQAKVKDAEVDSLFHKVREEEAKHEEAKTKWAMDRDVLRAELAALRGGRARRGEYWEDGAFRRTLPFRDADGNSYLRAA